MVTPMLRALLTALILSSATLPFAALAALPVPGGDAPTLRIQGSNTINAELGPALVEGLLRRQGLQSVQTLPGAALNEQRVTGVAATGQTVSIEVAAHGSGTGFTALKAGNADIAASSRPIKDQEAKELAGLGDLKSAAGEQIIAIDGVAVIVHPGNPLRQLDTQQLARIFSGEVRDWSEVGGNPGAIHLYVRDEKSGTYETFKELVLAKYGKNLSSAAVRFESSEQLSDEVSKDPNGVGFTGLPSIRRARAVAIADGESRPMLPTTSLVATEDYPLSRRLYLYVPPAASTLGAGTGALCAKPRRSGHRRSGRVCRANRAGAQGSADGTDAGRLSGADPQGRATLGQLSLAPGSTTRPSRTSSASLIT